MRRQRCPRLLALLGGAAISLAAAPGARADETAYLINVTVRPGYGFDSPATALDYGQGICGKIAAGRGYPQIMADIKADLSTDDDYQADYLVAQSANELCPELIWTLRQSAGHYRPPA